MNILQLMPNRNNPFDNFIQRTYQPQTPQNRLQMAYEQAMAKRTPEWARTVSDMMPSIAEMVAYGTTKGAFNQGRIVDALEREKQRRTAYNQMMRENEDKQVNDYVQMAKEQLGMDMALDEKEYKKAIDQLNRDERLEAQKKADERYVAEQEEKKRQQEIINKWREIDDINKREALEQAKIQQDIQNKRIAENDLLDRAYKQAQIDKINYETSPEYRNQILKQEEDKAKAEEDKAIKQEIKSLNDKGSIDSATYIAINNDTSLRKYLKPKDDAFGGITVLGTKLKNARPNTYEIDFKQILEDKGIKNPTKAQIKALKTQMGL